MSTVNHAPAVCEKEAVDLAFDLYGIKVTASTLQSERDQNFLLTDKQGSRFVLKIANAKEDRNFLDLQNQAMERLSQTVACPVVLPAKDGSMILKVKGKDGAVHKLRLLTYLDGTPLANVNPHTPELLSDLGRFLGKVDKTLDGFSHPAAERYFYWDIKNGPDVVRQYIGEIAETKRRKLVQEYLDRYETRAVPKLSNLRTGIIHNDGNDHNILISESTTARREVTGILDFGDMVNTFIAIEPAVTATYAMMDKSDPLIVAANIIAGYHEINPLTENELSVLFDFICMRLCMSVCIAAHQKKQRPGDEYLTISEKAAWYLLEKLKPVNPSFAHYTFRHAAGLEPNPNTQKTLRWLKKNRKSFAPVIDADLQKENLVAFDLGVGSLELAEIEDLTDTLSFTRFLFGQMENAGARIGIGKHDEVRRVYTSEIFQSEDGESRTLHVGIDLFAEAGRPVYAPLDGTVHSFQDNAKHLDYGPTIILRHETCDGIPFYTLYGHLSEDSLEGLSEGLAIKKGQPIARIGDFPRNGDWPPHLHFQLITNMLDMKGDFPGVAPPSQRKVWLSLCPDPNVFLGIPEDLLKKESMRSDEILSSRESCIGPSLSISYEKPLHIVRGYMQYLYDSDGQAYLDCVNNVAHVGHSHPRVIEAGRKQAAVLNTNTRYLHGNIIRYTQRLTSKLPDPLQVCFIVNSGSEANDLALRLAWTHTGRKDVLVIDGAYHGNLSSLIDISPYKFDGPGGRGAPDHVHKVPMPDPYRGLYRDAKAGKKYARHVEEIIRKLQADGKPPAAFIAESILSCGGQIVLPDGFLKEAYRHVRKAGGICIADEVQVGFGRVGTHFWGFESQGVIPDILTMGKPIGNGHPLAAVVTTREIADAFANGMEYFNTYGGNPVSCAAGLAVLDVIGEEGLQQNALGVGYHLLTGLKILMKNHPIIGDVRGLGLFVGIELVCDREKRTPAPEQATYIANRMREHRVLLSTDGPDRNVLKIKPPICFTRENADRLVNTLDKILKEDFVRRAE